jgi:predicted ATPase
MSRIKIRNFGPIRDGFVDNDGWMDISKVTVFIGNQGSGKSTVAKLISTLSWIEKDLFRSVGSTLRFRKQERIFKKYLEYHRIDSYLKDNTEIQYEGEAYKINYKPGKNLNLQKKSASNYSLPKITYFPAERNFVSSVKKSRSGQRLTLWSQSLQEFKETFQEAKENFKEKETFHLPISNVDLEYNKLNDILYVKGPDYKIQLADSASGFQSFVPLFVVANYVSKLLENEQEMDEQQRDTFKRESAIIINNKTYTEEQKRILLSNLASQFNIKRTLNIIEEPEQNLFPTSQQGMLYKLLEFNNKSKENQLIITTHSPYIIGYMTLAVKAMELYKKAKKEEVRAQINEIVPQKSAISHDDLVIYELDEKDGSIRMLGSKNGIPNDNDYLDNALGIINEMFSDLLDIEDLCQ